MALTRKIPLKAKATLKTYTPLKAKKSLRRCTIEKHQRNGNTCINKSRKPYKPKYAFESILTDDLSRCFITGCTKGYCDGRYHEVHIHHIFGGANKANSEKYHFLVPLRDDWHDMADYGIHFNKTLDLAFKRLCQAYWLMEYGTKEEFIKTFSKWW